MTTEQALATILKRLRREKNFAQDDFALIVGLHRTYISQLERGLKSPTLKTLQRVAEALGLSLVQLMEHLEKELEHRNGDIDG